MRTINSNKFAGTIIADDYMRKIIQRDVFHINYTDFESTQNDVLYIYHTISYLMAVELVYAQQTNPRLSFKMCSEHTTMNGCNIDAICLSK